MPSASRLVCETTGHRHHADLRLDLSQLAPGTTGRLTFTADLVGDDDPDPSDNSVGMTVSATGEIAIDGLLGLNDVVAHAADALRGSLGDRPQDGGAEETRTALPKPVPTSESPSAAEPPDRRADPAAPGTSPTGRSSSQQATKEGAGHDGTGAPPEARPSSTPPATPSSSAVRRPERSPEPSPKPASTPAADRSGPARDGCATKAATSRPGARPCADPPAQARSPAQGSHRSGMDDRRRDKSTAQHGRRGGRGRHARR